MLITTLPITHRIKHLQPIFSMDKSLKNFVTGGVNGEMKLWTLKGKHIKTVKRHSGSVTGVRFSHCQKYLASSGDDGKVYIFDSEANELKHTIKHKNDVTNLEWHPDYLVTVDLDGFLVITSIKDFTEILRVNHHEESIIGLCISPNYKYILTYSESKIVLFDNLKLLRTVKLEKRVIIESLNTHPSFSPNSKYLSIGLQFNGKNPTVDIFDLNLERLFSLVGHVAPSEVTSFCPYTFKKSNTKFCILAIASQDLSVSIWTTIHPKPFVLIKNFTESPVLELCWDGLSLYACSYDGQVKKIEFSKDEFGEIVSDEDEEEDVDLPFSLTNIELKNSYESRNDKLEMNQKLPEISTTKFVINGTALEEILEENNNSVPNNNTVVNNYIVANNNDSVVNDNSVKSNSAKLNTSKLNSVKLNSEKSNAVKDDDNKIKSNSVKDVNTVKSNIAKNDNNSQNSNQSVNPSFSIDKINGLDSTIFPAEERIDVQKIKPKRITPIPVNQNDKPPVMKISKERNVVMFDASLPEKLKIKKCEPFKSKCNEFTVEVNESLTKVTVFRDSKVFFTVNGPVAKVCFNKRYLVVYTSHLRVYDLRTGCLVFPHIFMKIAFLDLLNTTLLTLSVYGELTIYDLKKNIATVQCNLPKTKNLIDIELSKKFYVIAKYENDEYLYYNHTLKAWAALNPPFNSVMTDKMDFTDFNDETYEELENMFLNYAIIQDEENMEIIAMKFINIVEGSGAMSDYLEHKLEAILGVLENKDFVIKLLEVLNKNKSMQRFVEKFFTKLNK